MTEYFRRLETADGLYHDTRITEEEFYRPLPKIETVCQSSNPFDALLMREPLAEVTFDTRTYEYRETMQKGDIKIVRYVERYKPTAYKHDEVTYAYSFKSKEGLSWKIWPTTEHLKEGIYSEILYGECPLPLELVKLRCVVLKEQLPLEEEIEISEYINRICTPKHEYEAICRMSKTASDVDNFYRSLPHPWKDPEFKKRVCLNKEKGDETATTK